MFNFVCLVYEFSEKQLFLFQKFFGKSKDIDETEEFLFLVFALKDPASKLYDFILKMNSFFTHGHS